MTDTLLSLVPTYGIWLIFLALLFSCLALPIPSSILVMAAGAFAASGDLTLWQVQAAAFIGFILGDQTAYFIAAKGGTKLIDRFKRREKFAALFDKAEALIRTYGMAAVFVSRTICSPLGPYVGYLSGALKLRWIKFTLASIAGALCWSFAYSLLGYFFATRITQIASLISNVVGIILALAAVIGLIWYLVDRWRKEMKEREAEELAGETAEAV